MLEPPAPPLPSPLPPGLILPVRCGPGGPTPKEARGPHWRRTSHGYYVPATAPDDDVRQRIVEASVLVPPGGAITGWAALAWSGARWFDGRGPSGRLLPVPVATGGRDLRSQPGIRPCRELLDPHLVSRVHGLLVADPWVATSFEMRYAVSERDAVVALDMAAYSDLVSVLEIAHLLSAQSGMAGAPRARRALLRADENTWSPIEVDLRATWVDVAGRPRPVCNRPLFDRRTGAHIGTPDVFDPVAGVAGEYDGDVHLVRRQRDRDLRREGAFREHAIEIAVMTAADRHDASAFVRRLATAYEHAARHPPERTWTLEQPWWWTPTETVEQRRAITGSQRRRLLGHRAA